MMLAKNQGSVGRAGGASMHHGLEVPISRFDFSEPLKVTFGVDRSG